MKLTFATRLRLCWEVLTIRSGHRHSAQEKQLSTFQRGYDAGTKDAALEDQAAPRTCRNCSWWDDSPWQVSPETRLCIYPERRATAASWGFVEAGGPEFGCVHFKKTT
jgi:hypothetical protein